MVAKQKKNNSFLMQGMILAVAGIITRIIGANIALAEGSEEIYGSKTKEKQ